MRPGVVIGGEITQLVDRGFQKFFQTSKAEFPATADRLQRCIGLKMQVREVTGRATLYNEALGTTSDAYLYDRVKGRDLPESERPVRGMGSAAGKLICRKNLRTPGPRGASMQACVFACTACHFLVLGYCLSAGCSP